MKKFLIGWGLCSCIFLVSLTPSAKTDQPIGVEQTLDYFRNNAASFSESLADLQQKINKLSKDDTAAITTAKESLAKSRIQFKKIEFFFNYFFRSLTMIYNAPPIVEVEEPSMEYREPTGLQVIESLLFSDNPVADKKELIQQASLINESAQDINSLLFNLSIDDRKVLESIRLELIRIITLGITGFDAPELKTGIKESRQSLSGLKIVLIPYLQLQSKESDSIIFYLDKGISLIDQNSDFDSFNRMLFLTDALLPLQKQLNDYISNNGFTLNTTGILNYSSDHLFQPSYININGTQNTNPAEVSLGRKLFFDNKLSGNNLRSCATCHQPEKYFTDGLPKSIALDGFSTVQRNAPSLFYSSFQYSQFWDGRVKDLEAQIMEVLRNPFEMNANHDSIVYRLSKDKSYVFEFGKAFPHQQGDSSISLNTVSSSIAAFIKTLAPFSSGFDQYIKGEKQAMSNEQLKGFNLFMGKALCATCHVVPLFNGLTPPFFDRTTMEIIGAPANNDFAIPLLDADSGRYSVYPVEYYVRSFKTPGLRNVAKTAPYMHNGALPDLESVMEFYNKGGGNGLGLNIKHQTLSSAPLNLTESEIKSIIEFLHSLTDRNFYY